MTKEEALYKANHYKEVHPNFCLDAEGFWKAVIEALEQEPCGKDINVPATDAISRQAVLDAIDVKAWEFCDYLISKNRNDEQKPVSHFADNLRECVREELPPVTPQPQTGHWIDHQKGRWIYAQCTECGTVHDTQTNYCPNCGVKMQEVESEVEE